MKVTIKDMMVDSTDELTLWIDGDGDINLRINDQRTVCLGRLIEVKPTESQDELWKDLIDVYDVEDRKGYGYATLIKALSARFRIERI